MITRETFERLQNALDKLQAAQNLVNSAAGSICSVVGFGDEWTRVCKLGDQVKAEWHRIERLRAAHRVEAPAVAQGGS